MGWMWPFHWMARYNFPHHSLQSGRVNISWLASKGLSTSVLNWKVSITCQFDRYTCIFTESQLFKEFFWEHFILVTETADKLQTLSCLYPFTKEEYLKGTILCKSEG